MKSIRSVTLTMAAPACCYASIRLQLISACPMCIGIHTGGRSLGAAPMVPGAYSIQHSVMKRGYGAILDFSTSCVTLHYGCCENQLEPSSLASFRNEKSLPPPHSARYLEGPTLN